MTNDQTTEQAIQAAGANVAPRITPADIEAEIIMEVYQNSGDEIDGWTTSTYKSGVSFEGLVAAAKSLSTLTICVLVLRNGFTVVGESACASPENFNAEIGRRIARENAVAKIWPLMGYQLKENLYNLANGPVHTPEWPEPSGRVLTEADSMADLHGYARPDNPTV